MPMTGTVNDGSESSASNLTPTGYCCRPCNTGAADGRGTEAISGTGAGRSFTPGAPIAAGFQLAGGGRLPQKR